MQSWRIELYCYLPSPYKLRSLQPGAPWHSISNFRNKTSGPRNVFLALTWTCTHSHVCIFLTFPKWLLKASMCSKCRIQCSNVTGQRHPINHVDIKGEQKQWFEPFQYCWDSPSNIDSIYSVPQSNSLLSVTSMSGESLKIHSLLESSLSVELHVSTSVPLLSCPSWLSNVFASTGGCLEEEEPWGSGPDEGLMADSTR
jgi:hypothetical protein